MSWAVIKGLYISSADQCEFVWKQLYNMKVEKREAVLQHEGSQCSAKLKVQ